MFFFVMIVFCVLSGLSVSVLIVGVTLYSVLHISSVGFRY